MRGVTSGEVRVIPMVLEQGDLVILFGPPYSARLLSHQLLLVPPTAIGVRDWDFLLRLLPCSEEVGWL